MKTDAAEKPTVIDIPSSDEDDKPTEEDEDEIRTARCEKFRELEKLQMDIVHETLVSLADWYLQLDPEDDTRQAVAPGLQLCLLISKLWTRLPESGHVLAEIERKALPVLSDWLLYKDRANGYYPDPTFLGDRRLRVTMDLLPKVYVPEDTFRARFKRMMDSLPTVDTLPIKLPHELDGYIDLEKGKPILRAEPLKVYRAHWKLNRSAADHGVTKKAEQGEYYTKE